MHNTTIALAYINTTENPLQVFCNLFIYILRTTSANGQLRIDELQNGFVNEFGLKVPIHVLKSCGIILSRKRNIQTLKNGAGYAYVASSFDIEKFQSDLMFRKQQEEFLIQDLRAYLADLNVTWTFDETRNKLVDFFVKSNYAYHLFSNGTTDSWDLDIDDKKISSNWYISQYLKKLERNKGALFDYVIDITKGLMVYIGLSQFPDYNQNQSEKFRGTKFFFDTKLMLRYLGYSWPEMVRGTRELVELLRKTYGGTICIFQHTYQEIAAALSSEIAALSPRSNVKENNELECFRRLSSYTKGKFQIDLQMLEQTICEKEKIEIVDNVDVTTSGNKRYNIAFQEFVDYIRKAHPTWKRLVVENDVNSINQINILRQENYNTAYGGKKKLPVFVTTNYALINCCRNFFVQEYKDKGALFNLNHLPVVADSALTYRLWLPQASSIATADMPKLSLSRIVYTAQQENSTFYQKYRENLADYKDYGKISIDDLSEQYSSKLFEITARNANGDYENFTEEVLARSLDEFMKLESMDKDHKISSLEDKLQGVVESQEQTEKALIAAYTSKFERIIPIRCRLLLLLGNYWWIVSAVVVLAISVLFALLEHVKVASGVGIVISIALFFKPPIEKVVERLLDVTTDAVKRFFHRHSYNILVRNFQRKANADEIKYQEPILNNIAKKLDIEVPSKELEKTL